MTASAPDLPPFRAPSYALPGGLTLTLMTPPEAALAGAHCAAMDPWVSYPFPEHLLVAFFAKSEPDAPRFTLSLDGAFAGAIVVRLNWMRGPYIHMLMMAPAFQGRGYGSTLLAWTESQARANADRNLWIAATDTNTAAQRLYARHGFKRAANLDALVQDDRTEILMRKKLFAQS